ncbi:MAG TPA: RDD family protein [Burkholderiales bacterium]|nr:RDD family protein [Burkholderiales bacterium]
MGETPKALYPSILRRLAAMVYESLLVLAILIVAGMLFGAATHHFQGNPLFGIGLMAVLGLYFVWCWHRGGHTLAMKAWRLRLSRPNGDRISIGQGVLRFLAASLMLGTSLVGVLILSRLPQYAQNWMTWLLLAPGLLDLLWAVVDPDKQFLHDRIAHTRVFLNKAAIAIDAPPNTSSPAPS